MKNTKSLVFILFLVLLFACCFVGCTPSEEPEIALSDNACYKIIAELGYDYAIPDRFISQYGNLTVKNDEKQLTIKDGCIDCSSLGNYGLFNSEGKKICDFVVVDTEKPQIKSVGKYNDSVYVATMNYGESIDLDVLFAPTDNSGFAQNTYTVYEMGATKVELIEEHILKSNLTGNGFYVVEIFTQDNSGNSSVITYKITSNGILDPDNFTTKYTLEGYSWGEDINLIQTDFNEGDIVLLSGSIRYNSTEDRRLYIYNPAPQVLFGFNEETIQPLSTVTDYTSISVECVVQKDGWVKLTWGAYDSFGTYPFSIDFKNMSVKKIDYGQTASYVLNGYSWTEDFNLIQTEYSKGDVVQVSAEICHFNAENRRLYSFYPNANAANVIFTFDDGANPFSDVTEYTPATFYAVVSDNGWIKLGWGAAYDEGTYPFSIGFRRITVEKLDYGKTASYVLNGYSWTEDFNLIQTEYSKGDVVQVSAEICHFNAENRRLYSFYPDASTANVIFTFDDGANPFSDVTEYTAVTFNAIVSDNGWIKLGWGAAYEEGTCPFSIGFRIITVEKLDYGKTASYVLNGYSWTEDFNLIQTEYSKGDVVQVSAEVCHFNAENRRLYSFYPDASTANVIFTFDDGANPFSDVTEYTAVTFNAVVSDDGWIKLGWGAAYEEGTCPFSIGFRKIVVTKQE